jgi:Holliday junction resolvase RusA-like endonuclease
MYKFKLPLPPSVNNNKWVNPKTGRIVQKNEVRKWKNKALFFLNQIKRQNEKEWFLDLEFNFYYKNKPRKIDTDNRLKPIIDAISLRLGIDDSLLTEYRVKKNLIKGEQAHFVEGFIYFKGEEDAKEKEKEESKKKSKAKGTYDRRAPSA